MLLKFHHIKIKLSSYRIKKPLHIPCRSCNFPLRSWVDSELFILNDCVMHIYRTSHGCIVLSPSPSLTATITYVRSNISVYYPKQFFINSVALLSPVVLAWPDPKMMKELLINLMKKWQFSKFFMTVISHPLFQQSKCNCQIFNCAPLYQLRVLHFFLDISHLVDESPSQDFPIHLTSYIFPFFGDDPSEKGAFFVSWKLSFPHHDSNS